MRATLRFGYTLNAKNDRLLLEIIKIAAKGLFAISAGGSTLVFARRHFRTISDERCGDHLVSAYVARVNAMKRQFAKLAADGAE